MSKIKVEFRRLENVVIAKVLEMPEHPRANFTFAFGAHMLRSASGPDMGVQTLWLRGSVRDRDHLLASFAYVSAKEAIERIVGFSACIAEWNERNATDKPSAKPDSDMEVTIAE